MNTKPIIIPTIIKAHKGNIISNTWRPFSATVDIHKTHITVHIKESGEPDPVDLSIKTTTKDITCHSLKDYEDWWKSWKSQFKRLPTRFGIRYVAVINGQFKIVNRMGRY